MMPRDETEFIGRLYDAALGRLSWETIVAELATVIGSQTSSLISHDPLSDQTAILGMHCLPDDYMEVYGTSFFEHDLWTQEALRRRHYDRATLGIELVSEHQWERSVIYNEFLRPRTDAFHLVGGMVHLHGGGVLAIGCHRARSASAFSARHQAALAKLLPHLQRAVEIHQKFQEARTAGNALRLTVDSLSDAVVQLNDEGTILHLNSAAECVLTAEDGLMRFKDKLRAVSRAENSRLQNLIATSAQTTAGNASSGSGGYMRISRPSGRLPYALAISPLGLDRIALSGRHPAVLVTIADGASRRSVDVRALRELHGLSSAEARVAVGLATGHSLRQMALDRGVSINTVRTLAARAMSKTGTNSQVGLVKLILTGLSGGQWRQR